MDYNFDEVGGHVRVTARTFAHCVVEAEEQLAELEVRGADVAAARRQVAEVEEAATSEFALIVETYPSFQALDELMIAGMTRVEQLRGIVAAAGGAA